jgi:hypothetical protein
MSAFSNPLLRGILLVVGIVVVLLLVAFGLPALLPSVPARFWQLLALCAAALAILWWFTVGSRNYKRAGRARQRIGDLGPGNAEDEREPLEKMHQAIEEAKRNIQRSPEIGGRNSLYRVPWMLFLGDSGADIHGLLQAASKVSPFPPPAANASAVWRWWFFKSMIAIEASPALVCDASDRLQRGLWYQALMQLANGRDMLPLNGIVVGIGADTLLGDPETLKTVSMRLRRLVDEAMEHLQVQLPVYFVITGLERLPGYARFRGVLPAEALSQALGFRLPANEAITAGSSARLDAIVAPIVERLHALRMAALAAQHDGAGRRDVFAFVQSVAALLPGLRRFVGLLLEDNPFQRTPRWRGLYFAAGGGDGGSFVADLFTRFLPADQPLATTSLRGSSARLAVAGVGVAALLAFSGYLSYGIAQARQADARLLAQTRDACQGNRGTTGPSERIAWVASCGRTIEKLESSAGSGVLGFGIRRSDRDIERLKQEVVADFSSKILAPYDQMLDADISRGTVNIEHLLAVSQRLRILEHCRGGGPACIDSEVPHNVVFDPQSRLFAPFISPSGDSRVDRDNAQALMTTYLGYLRWQRSNLLDDEQHRLHAELQRLLTLYKPGPQDIAQWADARRDGVRLTDFWLPADRVVGVDAHELPTVSAAWTADTWNGVVEPMVATLESTLPEKKTLFDGFRKAYFTAYFQAWAQFQARFFEGVKLWKGDDAGLAARAAGKDNPYRFFFDSAGRNLLSLPLELSVGERWSIAWSHMRQSWLRAWRPFGHFIGGWVGSWFAADEVPPPTWLLAMQDTRRKVLEPQHALFADGYLGLQDDPSGQNLYPVMAELFAGNGSAAQPPASEYAILVKSVAKPDDRFATKFHGDDLAAWQIVQGPSRLLLYLTVQRVAHYIQQRWTESVVKPLSTLPPQEQVARLYGEHGRLNAFVGDVLKPFVATSDHTPVRFAGVALPLTPGFQAAVQQQSQLQPLLGADQPFLAGSFTITAPSQLAPLREGPGGTVLQVDCQGRVFSATSTAASLAQSKALVYWSPDSCTQASIDIDIATSVASPADDVSAMVDAAATGAAPVAAAAPVPAPPPLSLTLIYAGTDGFVRLLKDFGSGSHVFALDDFRASYSPAQWSALVPQLRSLGFSRVRVSLRAEPSDQMRQFLAARNAPTSLPATIVD